MPGNQISVQPSRREKGEAGAIFLRWGQGKGGLSMRLHPKDFDGRSGLSKELVLRP